MRDGDNFSMREVVWLAYLLGACRRIHGLHTDQDRPLLRDSGTSASLSGCMRCRGCPGGHRTSCPSSATAGRCRQANHSQARAMSLPQKIAQPMRSSSRAADLSCTTRISFIELRVAPTNSLRTAWSSSVSKSISARITAGADWPLKR